MKQVSQLLGASSEADPKFRRFLFWTLSTALTFYFLSVFHKTWYLFYSFL